MSLTATGPSGRAIASDLLIGDVWLCSGQSNMELQVSRALNSYNDTQAANDPELRILTVPHLSASRPDGDVHSAGRLAGGHARSRSATSRPACYYMVRELRRSQHVPIGAIAASWGGTPIRAWLDETGAAAAGGEDYRQLMLHRRDPAAASRAFGERWARLVAAGERRCGRRRALARQQPPAWSPVPRMSLLGALGRSAISPSFDGMVWMRKRVTLSAAQAARAPPSRSA